MGKFNLSDAAKAILTEGSKETFAANVAAKQGQRGSDGHPKGEVGQDALHGDAAYGTKEVGDIGTRVKKTNGPAPEPTKGVPTATPPGATPPVGSEPMKHLDADKDGQAKGRHDLLNSEEGHEIDDEDYQDRRDRKPSPLVKQTMQANPGATFQSYHEDIDAMLSGENLSEDFKSKATSIFEAAVIARAEEVIGLAEAELTEQFEAAVEEIKEDLAAKVDDYLNYMVQEWVKDNEIAIQKGLRAEIVEDFITGLKGLFEEHYIDIPADKVDVVEELTAKVEELESSLNEQIKSSVELQKELNESKKLEAIHAACEGLTQTQVEKMKSLAEGVEFTTDVEFASKLETFKESYFKAEVKVADSSALDDEVQIEEEKKTTGSSDPLMEQYAKTISKTLVK